MVLGTTLIFVDVMELFTTDGRSLTGCGFNFNLFFLFSNSKKIKFNIKYLNMLLYNNNSTSLFNTPIFKILPIKKNYK